MNRSAEYLNQLREITERAAPVRTFEVSGSIRIPPEPKASTKTIVAQGTKAEDAIATTKRMADRHKWEIVGELVAKDVTRSPAPASSSSSSSSPASEASPLTPATSSSSSSSSTSTPTLASSSSSSSSSTPASPSNSTPATSRSFSTELESELAKLTEVDGDAVSSTLDHPSTESEK